MESLKSLDAELYSEIEARATWTGNRTNGIKDGIRNEWYAKFDLESPAKSRGMPYTCVVERPELQEIMMKRTSEHIRTASGVDSYRTNADGSITALIDGGGEVHGDVLIGADGIWSNVRASMTESPTLPSYHPTVTPTLPHYIPLLGARLDDRHPQPRRRVGRLLLG